MSVVEAPVAALRKAPTGIPGLDEVTVGGLPAGRPTLLCGGPGCGKTLFAMTFLVNGATLYDEPAVFMSFEESNHDLVQNVISLGYDLPGLIAARKFVMDYVRVERGEIEEAGEYDLEGLFVRLGHAIQSVGAKRVVLDTLEVLFAGLGDTQILRSELRRLFGWLKEKGVTAIITAERGEGALTRYGLEEYVSDCVILLDHRVNEQITTRRLRVVKYRGSAHGTNEYPFLIDEAGISVLPVTSAGLSHEVSSEVISLGVPGLDEMFARQGIYKGSSILFSGTAGTGKSNFAAHFADSVCESGGRCLYFAFEESPFQIVRNMQSVGLDLKKSVDAGRLRFESARPSLYGLEMHVAKMHRDIGLFKPDAVILDPLSSFTGGPGEVHSALLRIIDLLKAKGITAYLTCLMHSDGSPGISASAMSSLMDSWVSLVQIDSNGERNRGLYILKSRGTAHSNQIREFELTSKGIKLRDAYLGSAGVLTGSARMTQEAADLAEGTRRVEDGERRQREIDRKRVLLERQIEDMRAAFALEEDDARRARAGAVAVEGVQRTDRDAMASQRGVRHEPKR